MACGNCPCNGGSTAGTSPDFPRASAVPDLPPVNVNVSTEADKLEVSGGGFTLESVEWWQWVLVAIAVLLLLREK